LGLAGLLFWIAWASPSFAGPAKYDPASRAFNLTYTYASLPHFGMRPQEVETLGALQKPGPGQDEKVRGLHQAVSQVLFEITDGRAKIGSLEYVENIKNADIIVSMTGNFNRAGWAISGAIEGRPGQIGLYYLYLSAPERPRQDVVLTVAHELAHYLFGLPDEYSNTDPAAASCPVKNPGGPGCLMDNYMTRHGFLALCTNNDHNPDGPRQNPGTIIQSSSPQTSCAELVERFFRAHPPVAGGDPSSPSATSDDPTAPVAPMRISTENPFNGRFKRLVESSISFVREQAAEADAEAVKAGKKPKQRATVDAASAELGPLRKAAESYLKKQLEGMINDGDFVPPTKDQVKQAIDFIAQRASVRQVDRPATFDRNVVDQLRTKAKEFAAKEMGTLAGRGSNSTNLLRMLFGDPTDSEKQLNPVVDKVKKQLVDFLFTLGRRALIGFSPTAAKPSSDEQRFIEQIAREAVRGSNEPSEFTTYFQAAELHIRLSENAAATLNAVASELNLPGAEHRRIALRDLQKRLERFALPGKPFTGFGFRRTFIIAPHPVPAQFDYVAVDAGEEIPYHEVRNLTVREFMSLIQRERTVFLNDPLTPPPPGALRPPGAQGANDLGEPPTGLDSEQRFGRQVQLINTLADEILRDRDENIVILTPPGGLTQETGDSLEVFRQRVLNNAGVRVDLVTLGSYPVPLRLRDLVHKSGGTVQSAIDIDEAGAISQRLMNDQAAGSWVAIPEQGFIDLSPRDSDACATTPTPTPTPTPTTGAGQSLDALQQTYVQSDRPSSDEPILKIIERDFTTFNKRVNLLIKYYAQEAVFLPRSYDDNVRATLTRLNSLARRISLIGQQLIELEMPGLTIQNRLDRIKKEIQQTKSDLRYALKGGPLYPSPLTNTDDYLDYTLRIRLQARARAIAALVDDGGRFGKMPSEFRAHLLRKASYLTRRATERDQRLADAQQAIYQKSLQINTKKPNGPPATEAEMGGLKDQLKSLMESEEVLERTATSSTPYASEDLLVAAKMQDKAAQILAKQQAGKPWNEEIQSRILESLEREASLLERASVLGLGDQIETFGIQVITLRRQVTALQALKTQQEAQAAGAGLSKPDEEFTRRFVQLQASLLLLLNRSEHLVGGAKAVSRPQGGAGQGRAEEDPTNALTPLGEALKTRTEIETELSPGRPQSPKYFAMVAEFSTLQFAYETDEENEEFNANDEGHRKAFADIVHHLADELAHSDFPRLLLDTLGRVRRLEDDLAAAREKIFETKNWRSPSARLNERRTQAQVDFNPFRNGKHISVTFGRFQAERDADYEIVLGLSRPLREFEELKLDHPQLQLLREGNLEEKPYLGFVPEVSTPTMLVFRAPKPSLRAGVIGEGLYTPRLIMDRRYFPVVGRDNRISYTFSVATPRPNVQLIASLRQPQAKDGDFDPMKDPEYAYRGTIPANLTEAIIEVQVLAGASVRNAAVTGKYQRFDSTDKPIDTPSLTFLDDGIYPDLSKDDGVYTARVTLEPSTRRRGAEYRVWIQARPTEDVRFIALAEPLPRKDGTEKADLNTEPPPVPPFQRATSLNFRVAGEN
jgi:hypothetical protein